MLALREIVGAHNLSTDDYDRLSVAYGKTMFDVLRLRKHICDNVPDVVLYPENKQQIERIVEFCSQEKIPLYVYGGGSSVTRGVEPIKGGISLDMRRNFNKVVDFTEVDQTITVAAGMSGTHLAETLRNAQKRLGAQRAYPRRPLQNSSGDSSVTDRPVALESGQN